MSEEKKFPVMISFMGKKFRATIVAQTQMEADIRGLSFARAKVQIIKSNDIEDFLGNITSVIDTISESKKMLDEGTQAMEELNTLQLMGKPTATQMKEVMGKILAWAQKSYEAADILIEIEKRHLI